MGNSNEVIIPSALLATDKLSEHVKGKTPADQCAFAQSHLCVGVETITIYPCKINRQLQALQQLACLLLERITTKALY